VKATYETKVRDISLHALFEEMAALYGQAERRLYVDRYIRGRALKDLKREYQGRFGTTARQFNAIAYVLDGKVKAARQSRHLRETSLRRRIAATQRKVHALQTTTAPGEKVRFTLHQKRRRLQILKHRLEGLQKKPPGICFGSRRLFRAQFHLEKSGYASHDQWLEAWRSERASQFFCLGSRGESSGNQSATLMGDGSLRLRVPSGLSARYGRWVILHDVRVRYGQDVIDHALLTGQAISYRFVRRNQRWYIKATTERPDARISTHRSAGAVGIDLNPHLVAVGAIDRHGNPVKTRHIPLKVQGRRRAQVTACLSEAVADIVAWARSEGVPVVIEKLDFERKKASLREEGIQRARMLSAFAYHRFHALLVSRAAREGVEVIQVNPAFTSVIGLIKFSSGYGLSRHASAAVAVARRGLKFGERLRSRSAFPLPARIRGEHVWKAWGRLSRRLRAERSLGRRPSEGSWGRGNGPLSATTRAQTASSRDDVAPSPG
jgi:IS605 OrfB family transposase